MDKRQIKRPKELRGGPLNGTTTNLKCSYLDDKGKPIPTDQGDALKRSGKHKLYLLRGAYYEWVEGVLL